MVDLENDYINPHDATRRINSTLLPELVGLGVMMLLLLGAGRFVFFMLLLALVAYKAHKHWRSSLVLDVTEIFGVINVEKRARMAQIVWLAVLFIYAIIEVVYASIAAGEPRSHPGALHSGPPVTITHT